MTGEETDLETDGLFVAIGHDPTTALFLDQLDHEPDTGYLVTRGQVDRDERARRVRRRRRAGSHLPAGGHRGRLRLRGGARRGALPRARATPRQPPRPDGARPAAGDRTTLRARGSALDRPRRPDAEEAAAGAPRSTPTRSSCCVAPQVKGATRDRWSRRTAPSWSACRHPGAHRRARTGSTYLEIDSSRPRPARDRAQDRRRRRLAPVAAHAPREPTMAPAGSSTGSSTTSPTPTSTSSTRSTWRSTSSRTDRPAAELDVAHAARRLRHEMLHARRT